MRVLVTWLLCLGTLAVACGGAGSPPAQLAPSPTPSATPASVPSTAPSPAPTQRDYDY